MADQESKVSGRFVRALMLMGAMALFSVGLAFVLGASGIQALVGRQEARASRSSDETRVSLKPSESTVRRGEQLTLTIELEDVSSLYGLYYVIYFDPQILEVVDADLGTLGIQIYQDRIFEGRNVCWRVNDANNVTGVITYGAMLCAPSPPFYGSGDSGEIRFYAKNVGVSAVRFDRAVSVLSDANARPITTAWQSAQVTVILGAETPSPTGTVVPSPTSTGAPGPTHTPTPVMSPELRYLLPLIRRG